MIVFLFLMGIAHAQTNITALEFFIDSDPGPGNGTSIPLTVGPTVSETFNISTATLSPGLHFLYIRALDENGIWTATETRAFVIQLAASPPSVGTEVTAMEYFIDDDPGAGNGIPIAVTPGTSVNINISIDVSSLSSGLHFLYIRTQDDLGNWGTAERRPFQVAAPVAPVQRRIVQIEYFFDLDPGAGNGMTIDVSPVNSLTIDTVLNTSSLALGPHDLGVRVLDEQGTWSATEINAVTVCDGPNPDFSIDLNCVGLVTNFTDNSLDVVAGDTYRWDFDGDGTFDDFTAGNTSFTYSGPGTYIVQLQIEPVSGCIGNFYQSIEVLDVPQADFSISGNCTGVPVVFNDLSINTGSSPVYEWDFDGDATIDDNTAGSTQFTYSVPGDYSATLRVTTGLGCTTQQIINVTIEDIPPTPQVSSMTGFSGESITLTASGGADGDYRWYEADGITLIPGETNSTYTTPALLTTTIYFVSLVSTTGLCESQRVPVEAIIESPDIEVFNVVTVRENGKHDFLKIVNIDQYPGNKVTIYNRWGDKVFDISNYDNLNNVFKGIDNSGNELPDGNYYYVIDKNDGSDVENGYLLLRR